MIGQPQHGRRLALCAVALTMQRESPHDTQAALSVRDELEKVMIDSGYLTGAPFSWVGLSVRYGLVDEKEPHYQGIDKKDGELALAIEIDIQGKRYASLEEMTNIFKRATLIALIHAGKKYDRPVKALEDMLENLPDSIEE